jgi:hypothetical protein
MAKPYTAVNTTTDTFGGWVTKTNNLLADMTTIIVTADQGAGTGVTTGNVHVQGVLSGATVVANTALRGGNTTVSGDLTISSSAVFTGSTVTSTANVALSGNLTLSSTARTLAVAANTQFSGQVTMANTALPFSVSSSAITLSTLGTLGITANQTTINSNISIPNTFLLTANGANLTTMNATQLTTGTIPDTRIASTIARSNITITTPANAGITGGGDLTASRTLVVDGTIIPYLANNQTFSGTSTFANLRTSGNMLPSANNTLNIGSTALVYANMFATLFTGTATSARYADLAEKYLADESYDVGTVIAVGGTAEVTAAHTNNAHSVIGVVSDKPAYLMNTDLENGTIVALKGRVPVKVTGGVSKGDRLVASYNPGYAMTNNGVGRVFAIALESGSNMVEAIIL